MHNLHLIILFFILLQSCQSTNKQEAQQVQTISLLGTPFYEPQRTASAQIKLDSMLNIAKKNFETNPSEENYIWLGRRTAYLSRFNEAIEIFSAGLKKYPKSFRLYRHRGHRYISIRDFDKAITDFQQAANLMEGQPIEIEPDGQPNRVNTPIGTTQFNVWYHLGLAYYLKNDFENAIKAYKECMKVSNNDDLLCATTDWLYMSYRRLEKSEDASILLENIHENMKIIENESYHLRLLMYKGLGSPDSLMLIDSESVNPNLEIATQGYGLGNWYLYNGDPLKAKEVFEKVVKTSHWSAFGFIASEAELHRMGN